MIPPCFNRPPRVAGTWEPTGRRRLGHHNPRVHGMVHHKLKPVLRWRPSPFEDRCATHDGRGIGPNGESYPEAHGFECAGCRWEPEHVRQRREFDARMSGHLTRAARRVAETNEAWAETQRVAREQHEAARRQLEELTGMPIVLMEPFWGDPPGSLQSGTVVQVSTPSGYRPLFERLLQEVKREPWWAGLSDMVVDKPVRKLEVIHSRPSPGSIHPDDE